jgi:hypothetical protein
MDVTLLPMPNIDECFITLDGILRFMASEMDCQFVSQSGILKGNDAFIRRHPG